MRKAYGEDRFRSQSHAGRRKAYREKLTIGYNNRFRDDSMYLKGVCEEGELGEIYGKALAVRRRAVPTWGVFLDEEARRRSVDRYRYPCTGFDLVADGQLQAEERAGITFHKLGQRENAANAFGPGIEGVQGRGFGIRVHYDGERRNDYSGIQLGLNVVETGEAKAVLAGTEGGADMKDGLRINGEKMSRLYETKVDLNAGGVAFYSGSKENDADREARMWLEAIIEDKDPVVKPEQAFVVTQILEAIYESAKTGKAVYFDN